MTSEAARPRLTQAQRRVLKLLAHFIRERGYAPSYRELAKRGGYRNVGAVVGHLRNLERHGYIVRAAGVARSLRVVEQKGE